MKEKIDLIIIGKLETVDYSGYSQLPLDRIQSYQSLVQLRMVYLDGGFHSFLDIFNKIKFGKYYLDSSYSERREMYNIWNLPSLNPGLAAAPLIHQGLNVKIINNLDSEFDLLLEWAEKMENPLIAISTTFMLTWAVIKKLSKKIRSEIKNPTLIIGGAFINDIWVNKGAKALEMPLKKNGISHAIYSYNSEHDLLQLVEKIKQGFDPNGDHSSIKNLVYFNSQGEFQDTGERWNSPYIKQKDAIPWDKINMPLNNKTIQVRMSSGCTFKCSFCTYPVTTKGFHKADLEYLESQLDAISKLNIENLIFIDDTPNIPPDRFDAMIELLKKYNFRWYSFLRIQFLNDKTARAMKESGCDGVYLGVESANDQILKNMDKMATRKKFIKGMEYLKKYDITSFVAFIVGFPGETEKSIKDNVTFIQETGADFYSLKEFWYAPNAPIAKKAEEFGLKGFGNDWSHNTMTSVEASEAKLRIFNEIGDSSICLDSDAGLWYLAYLRDQNFDWKTIREAQKIINLMLQNDNERNYHLNPSLLGEMEKVLANIHPTRSGVSANSKNMS